MARGARAASGVVPDDFATVQAALDQALPGDTIEVKDTSGPYFEKVEFTRGGDAAQGFISLAAYPGHVPILDGTGVVGSDMVLIDTKSWVRIRGFEIRNHLGVNDGSGVRVLGSGSHIEILENHIHDIRGRHAMAITVYGTDPSRSISDLVLRGNLIHDCEPASSEAVTLNGNVERFVVEGNVVRDVNNIGIDFIGGETSIQPDPTKVARDGVCRANRVERARGPWGAGIYVDGGRDILLERNVVTECELGIEVGAENSGVVASGIEVRDNLVYWNDRAGIVFGGYAAGVGRVERSTFRNNTTFENDRLGEGLGELWIQYASDNDVRDNVFHATAQGIVLTAETGAVSNRLDFNLWSAPVTPEFAWRGTSYPSLAAYQAATGQDASSLVADPLFVDPVAPDLHLQAGSPAIDRADPLLVPAVAERDIDDEPRRQGSSVDLGADERAPACLAGSLSVSSGLLAWQEGTDVVFAWTGDPGATEQHLNSVTQKEHLLAPGPHRPPATGGLGTGRCSSPVTPATCRHTNGVTDPVSLLFYRALAACGPGGDEEGPD